MTATPLMVLRVRGLPVQAPGGRNLLTSADLQLDAGESVAVQGPNGSGKSTLLGLVTGLVPSVSGSVQLAGEELVGMRREERAAHRLRHVGFVFQGGHLLPELSAKDNVALPLRLAGVRRREARERARSWLDAVGLSAHADQHPSELSGGEAQRVAVARALVHEPSLLVADEPTGSLDDENSAKVMELLLAALDRRAAVLLVTHDSRVAAVASRRLFLQDRTLTGAARPKPEPT